MISSELDLKKAYTAFKIFQKLILIILKTRLYIIQLRVILVKASEGEI